LAILKQQEIRRAEIELAEQKKREAEEAQKQEAMRAAKELADKLRRENGLTDEQIEIAKSLANLNINQRPQPLTTKPKGRRI